MARINIEDTIKNDIRFTDLISLCGNDYEKALGALVRAWMIGQSYWSKDESLIPKEVWKTQRLNNLLIECGLVEEKEHGYYCRGSRENFAWLIAKVKNGQKGGIQSGTSRKPEINNLGASETKQDEATASKTKPLTLSPSLTLSLTPAVIGTELKIVPARPQVEIKISESKTVTVSRDLMSSWADTYPREYLADSLKKARNWILANEHKAPKSQWGRFFNGWFARDWEKYRTTLKSKHENKITLDDLNQMLGEDV